MADSATIKARLGNIRTVEPILGALRTISLGSWRAALNQQQALREYVSRLEDVLSLVVPHLNLQRHGMLPGVLRRKAQELPPTGRAVVLAVGSDRGLCGRFNAAVVEHTERYLAEKAGAGVETELMVLGSRVLHGLERSGHEFTWSASMPTTKLPSLSVASDLMHRWLERYEAGEFDAVTVIYNAYRGVGHYESTVVRVLPPAVSAVGRQHSEGQLFRALETVVETDPLALYTRLVEQVSVMALYALLLDSAAAEHATRYQLMEGAKQNAGRLIEDLTSELQAMRRQAITQEMQELAAGAGLVR